MERRSRGAVLVACSLAAGLGIVALQLGWQGADWPAQIYRVDLFRRVGFTQWDNQWYGGHHTPGYSLLMPPLGAVLGLRAVAVASGALATLAFAALVRRRLPDPGPAVIVFGIGTVSNLIVGRVTFGLGLAVGMLALATLVAGRHAWAVALAVLTPLASPIAGVFLTITAAAHALAVRPIRRAGLIAALAAALPVGALALSFPEGGRFPFLFGDYVLTVGAAVAAICLLPYRYRAVRLGAAFYAAAATVVFFVPNPIGGNISRLAVFVAAPLTVGMLWSRRRLLVIPLLVVLGLWQWQPAFDGMTEARRDPSLDPSYYAGLIAFVTALPPTRIEIPFTRRHWEAARMAPHVALARGWERQIDIGDNPLFYEPGLTIVTYHAWLVDNAISYVALPDVELDPSARAEARLLADGVPGLTAVWADAHWRVWKVEDARPLVDPPAVMTRLDPDSFTVVTQTPADILVRVHYSSHWDVDGPGCVVPSPDGWTLVRAPRPGPLRVRQVVSRWNPFRPARTDSCPGDGTRP